MELSKRLNALGNCAQQVHDSEFCKKLFREWLAEAKGSMAVHRVDLDQVTDYLNGEFNGDWTDLLEDFQKLAPWHFYAASVVACWD